MWKPPEEFEEYELVELIGRGGMGAVYLARDTILDRAVAIKFIAMEADRQARERFLIEARAVARIQHPNVVAIYRVGEVEGRPFIVSELVRGKRLDFLAGHLEGDELLRIAIQLSRGLAVAHRRGVLHRDLKPENAILAEAGEVKLLDFGIAKLTENADRLSLTSSFVGWDEETAVAAGAEARETITAVAHRATAADVQAPTLPGKRPAADSDLEATAAMDLPASARAGASFRSGERAGDTTPKTDKWWLGAAASTDSSSPTHAGAVMGTPYYIAPEIWSGEPATTRSDVYSLGALLYMLAAGRPPHEGDTLYAIADKARHEDAAPVAELAPGVPEALAAIIDGCLARKPEARPADGDAVRDALEALTTGARVALPAGNPYRGLAAFEAEHQGLFFGRGREIRAVVERLRASPRVLVAGDSGVGKSSLLRAGVLPYVAQHGLGDGRDYLTMTMVPSHAPWTTFVARLGALLDLDDLEADDDPAPIARALRRRLGASTGALVLIDQLEELSTLADAEESALLAEALLVFGHSVPGLRVACTVRADFLTRVSALPGIGEAVDRSLYLLRPMDAAGIREAITGPAAALGFSFEDEALVEDLAEGAGGGLPLLQFCLAELWEGRDRAERRISRRALDDLGGVHGALSQHADAVIAELRPGPRRAARSLLSKLVSTSGTRQRLSEAELCGDSDDARAALDALVRGRLVTAREAESGTELEIAHEALIESWGTLAGWLSEDAGRRAVMERLRDASREWERLGRAKEALWQPRQLAELSDLDPDELGDRERAFQTASRAHVRRRKLLRWGGAAAVVLAIAGVYAGVTLRNHQVLERRVEAELRVARDALAQARAEAAEEGQLRAEAFALFDRGKLESAEEIWTRAAALRERASRAYGKASQQLERALTLDAGRGETRALLAAVLYERALRAEESGDDAQAAEYLERLELYDDGSFAARLRVPATISLSTEPPGAAVTIARYQAEGGRRVLGPARPLGTAPLAEVSVEPGSYMLELSAPGRETTRYPLELGRGEQFAADPIHLPAAGSVPAGFVHVPAGRFVFGSVVDYSMRDNYLESVPAHEVPTDAYLIATTEVTYGDYIEYLETLSVAERDERRPKTGSVSLQGSIELSRRTDGWHLRFQPNANEYRASWGAPIRYEARSERSEQDWRRMPVSGINFGDAEAYVAWLARTGRVPGARLCSEIEWERAGRGADGRVFANGDDLVPGEANVAETYASDPLRFGPDEVASFPNSRSPFGLYDMSGNVWEMTRSLEATGQPVARGGSFPLSGQAARLDQREPIDTLVSDITLGFRVCADPAW